MHDIEPDCHYEHLRCYRSSCVFVCGMWMCWNTNTRGVQECTLNACRVTVQTPELFV